jgi:XTP/dITP diphosphohydrolase
VKLLVASRNRKKLAELHRVLDAAGITGLHLLTLDDVPPFEEAPETGATFEDNAIAKARDAFAATGLPSLADDSGLAVAALNGMPGVLSARWSGGLVAADKAADKDAVNYRLLLAQMGDVPDERRDAAFVSVCALVTGPGVDDVTVVRGEWPGMITREPLGKGGFGYDPVFIPVGETPGGGRSAAQLTPAEKDSVSHRGRALALLVPALRRLASRD